MSIANSSKQDKEGKNALNVHFLAPSPLVKCVLIIKESYWMPNLSRCVTTTGMCWMQRLPAGKNIFKYFIKVCSIWGCSITTLAFRMLVRSTGTSKEGKDLLSTTLDAKETRPVCLIALTPNGIVSTLSINTGCPKLSALEIQPVRAGWDLVFLTACCRRQNCGPGEAAGVACFQGEKVATRTDNEIIFFSEIWNIKILKDDLDPVGAVVKRPTTSNTVALTTPPTGGKKSIEALITTKENFFFFRFQVPGRSIQPVLQGEGDCYIRTEASPYTTSQRGVQTNRKRPI